MTKYLLLYRADVSAQDRWPTRRRSRHKPGWTPGCSGRAAPGSAIIDMGAPVSFGGTVGTTYPASEGHIGGYSVLEADSLDSLKGLLDGHPHLMMGDGAGIDIHELLQMPGMSELGDVCQRSLTPCYRPSSSEPRGGG